MTKKTLENLCFYFSNLGKHYAEGYYSNDEIMAKMARLNGIFDGLFDLFGIDDYKKISAMKQTVLDAFGKALLTREKELKAKKQEEFEEIPFC